MSTQGKAAEQVQPNRTTSKDGNTRKSTRRTIIHQNQRWGQFFKTYILIYLNDSDMNESAWKSSIRTNTRENCLWKWKPIKINEENENAWKSPKNKRNPTTETNCSDLRENQGDENETRNPSMTIPESIPRHVCHVWWWLQCYGSHQLPEISNTASGKFFKKISKLPEISINFRTFRELQEICPT